jgi:hypothetical protein
LSLFGDDMLLFDMVVYASLAATLNIRNFFEIVRRRELDASKLSQRLTELQLQTLRMQIDPRRRCPRCCFSRSSRTRHARLRRQDRTVLSEARMPRRGDNLAIATEDDGVGGHFYSDPKFEEGIGLTNVRGRLEQLYGSEHKFALAAGRGHANRAPRAVVSKGSARAATVHGCYRVRPPNRLCPHDLA